MARELVPLDFDPFEPETKAPAPAAGRKLELVPLDFDPFEPAKPAVAAKPAPQPEDETWFESTANRARGFFSGSAVGRGFTAGMLEENPANLGEAVEGFGHLAGSDWAIGKGAELREWARTAASPELRKRGQGILDSGSIDEFFTNVGETFGSGVASTLPSIGAGLGGFAAGGAAGGAVAGPAGAAVGGIGGAVAGAGSVSYVQSFGELYAALKEEGVEAPRAAEVAKYGAVPIAALDFAGLASIAKVATGEVRREIARGLARRLAAAAAKGATAEGLTEAAQEATKEAVVSYETGKPWTGETFKGIAEAGIGGAIVGGPMAAPGGFRRDTVTPPPAPPADPIDPTLPPPSQGDIDSPIPTALIQKGRAKMDELLGQAAAPAVDPGSGVLDQSGPLSPAPAPAPEPTAAPAIGAPPPGYEPIYDDKDTEKQVGWINDRFDFIPLGQEPKREAPAAAPEAVPAREAAPAVEQTAQGDAATPGPEEGLKTNSASPAATQDEFGQMLTNRPTGADARPIGVSGSASGGLTPTMTGKVVQVRRDDGRTTSGTVVGVRNDGKVEVKDDLGGKIVVEAGQIEAVRDGEMARLEGDPGILRVATPEAAMPEPEQPGLPGLRRPGDYGGRAVDSGLPGVPGRDRPAPEPEALSGQDRRVEGVRAGQRALGDANAAIQKPSGVREGSERADSDRSGGVARPVPPDLVQSTSGGDGRQSGSNQGSPSAREPAAIDDARGQDLAPEGMGAGDRDKGNDDSRAAQARVERGTFSNDADAPQKPRFDDLTPEGRRAVFKAAGYNNTKALTRSKVNWQNLTDAERAMFTAPAEARENPRENTSKPETAAAKPKNPKLVPVSKRPKEEPPRRAIGENRFGQPVFEDERGVRSYVADGIRMTESVAIAPDGSVSIRKDARSDSFKTRAESEAEIEQRRAARAESIEGMVRSMVGDDKTWAEILTALKSTGPITDAELRRAAVAFREAENDMRPGKPGNRKAQATGAPPIEDDRERQRRENVRALDEQAMIPDGFELGAVRKLDKFDVSGTTRTVGDFKAVVRRVAPFGTFDGYGPTREEAIKDALRQAQAYRSTAEKADAPSDTTPKTPREIIDQGGISGALTEPPPAAADSPPAQEPKKPDGYGEGNKVFTADAAEKARAILRAKLKNQVSSGLDPEIVQAGITLAGYHIEAGARKFADYSRAMIADLGEEVRPYLRSWYEGVRYYPGFDAQGMSTATEIEAEAADGTEPAVRAPEESVQPEAGAVPDGRSPTGAPETEGERAAEGAPRSDRRGGRRGARSVRDAAPDQSERPEGDGGTAGLLPADSADRGGDRPERRRVRAAKPVAEKAVKEVAEGRAARARKNYQITEDDRIGQGGPKEKVRANIEAIRTLKRIEDEKRQATPEEKRALVKFVGWGAFAQPIFDSRPRPEWKDERAAVFDLLTPEEIAAARKSTLNAHYTSEPVIRGMWDALAHLGFKGGRALEPSAGVGHFIGMTPESVRDNTAWTAVELDTTTGRIAQMLYDGSDVNVQGFEDFKRPNDFFDLAISNVPFGDFTIRDTKRPGLLIHDYFFVKGLDLVRPGGLVAFITSSGTMDKLDKKARRLILDRADFLGAIRLPGGDRGAFAGNAGTEVTTDIIFLRKRGIGQEPRHAGDFLETKRIETPEGPTSINAYFAANRDMMLGDMRLVGSMYRANSPVLVGDATDIDKRIAKAARKMEAGAMLPRQMPPRIEKAADLDLETDGIKEGAIYQKGGKAFRKVNGIGQELKLSAADAKKLPGFLAMRDAVNKLLAKQARGDRAGLDGLRKDLTKAYDAFVKEHGPINRVVETVQTRTDKKTGAVSTVTIRRLPNFTPFADDPDAYKTAAIEEYDEVTDTGRKAAIFTTDIVGAYQPPEVTGPTDAIAVSLNERGKVDIPLIAERMGLSEAETISALGDLVYEDPITGDWRTAGDYLSGDVVTALERARAGAKSDPDKFARNVEALEKVQPTPLTRVDVRVNLGAPWVPTDIYEDFLRSIGGREISVRMNPVTKTVQVAEGFFDSSAQGAYGTSRADARDVVNAALKQTSFKIYDRNADGDAVVNEPATQEVLVKIAALREAFAGNPEAGIEGWVWQDETRAERLEALYNASFNRLVPVVYDGSHLALPGLAKSIVNGNGETIPFGLRPHQKDAVWRVIQSGNTLLDHVVGAGKTFTMIAAGMEQKRLGLIQRPMYVVPNHMLEQFSREFYQAYPNAKLLVATKDQMTKDRRKEFAARVAADRWDGIIITHDAFGRIGMSAEASARYLNDEVARLQTAIDAAREEEGAKSRTVKEIEKAKEKIEARVEKLMNVERKDEGVTFEELGIDFLVVDEAHLFKNLRIATRHTRVKGIGKSASQRAEDLFIKIRTLEQSRPGRSTLFATGTPISNTMAEMYVMQRYLQNDTLVEYGVDEFDAWAATFGEITTQMELAPNGRTFQETTSFAKFVNIPELVALYSKVADVKTAEMLNLPRPTLRGGAIKVVEAEPSEAEEQYIADLVDRAAAMKGKRIEKGGDNMLKIVSEGRKVATDFRLLRPDAEINPDGKIAKAVDNLYRIWKDGKDPALAQIVFLDMGVPSSKKGAAAATPQPETRMEGDEAEDGADVESSVLYEAKFNLYEDIRERLVARGIPKEQIAFIHEATDDVKKGALFRKVRSGEVRILIGSTGKMGVGTNVQRKLIAMHHLDAPWKPAEVEQRDGRIIRQGNENREVDMFRYITKRSFDSFMWQALERKSKFIAQIKAGARGIRSAEDIDDPLPEAAALKAAASGDIRVIEHAELSKEIRDLENQKRNHDRTIQRAKAGLASAREQLSLLEVNKAALDEDAAAVVDISGDKFKVDLAFNSSRGTMMDRRTAGEATRDFMVASARSIYSQVPVQWSLGTIGGLRMRASVRRTSEGFAVTPFVEGKGTYSSREFLLTEDADPVALIGRWERIVRDIPPMAAEMPERVTAKRDEVARLTSQAKDAPFPKDERLTAAKRRMIDLEAALRPKDPEKAVDAAAPTQMGAPNQFSEASPAGWDMVDADPAPRLTEAELDEIGEIIARVSGLESFRRAETIPIPANSAGARAWGRTEAGRASAFYNRIADAVTVALDMPEGLSRRVAYHESFHRLQRLFLSDKERATLVAEADRLRGIIAKTFGREEQAARMEQTEVEAEAFALYTTAREQDKPVTSFPVRVRMAFAKIDRTIRAVRNWLAGRGFQTYEDVFEAAARGDIARRTPRGVIGTGVMQDFSLVDDPDVGMDFGAPRRSVGEALFRTNMTLFARVRAATSWDAVSESIDRWRFNFQDIVIDLKQVQREIVQGLGRNLAESQNPYLAYELYEGRAGPQLEALHEDMVAPLVARMHDTGISVDDLGRYLYARHAPERNARIAKINPEIPEGGSGMTDAEAEAIMDEIAGSGQRKDYEALAEMVDRINAFAIETRVEGGLLSEEQAQAWSDLYQHYVPLRGFEEMDPDEADSRPNLGGTGVNVRGAESRRALGRTSKAGEIVAHVIMQAQEAIARAERNRVGQALYNLAVAAPNKDFWTADPVKTKAVWNKKLQQVVQMRVHALSRAEEDHTVYLKIEGKEHRVTFNLRNPRARRLAEGMRRLKGKDFGALVRTFGAINRYFSLVNTALNPEFVITNAFRDAQTAAVNLNQFDVNGIVKKVAKSYWPSLKESMGGAFAERSSEWGPWYRQFIEAGGRTYWNQIESVEDIRARLERDMLAAKGGFSVKRAFGTALKFVENANMGVENGIRLAVFRAAREAGMSQAQAASVAKNITVNFGRRGAYGPLVNSLYLFFNASVQGTFAILGAMRSARVRKIVAGIVATGAMVTLYNALAGGEDDDGEKFYDKIPDFDRQRNIILMMPGGKSHIKVPMPYGYNAFYGLGRTITEGAFGRKPLEAAADAVVGFLDAFNPIGGSDNLLKIVSPTIVDPIVELYGNRDFAGRPIAPDPKQFGAEVPNAQRFWASVNPVWRKISELFTAASGGDEVRPGAIDLSPEWMEYIFGVATGATGQFVSRSGGSIMKLLDPASDMTWNDVPFARKIVGGKAPWVDKSAFYERLHDIEQQKAYVKRYGEAGNEDGARAVIEEERDKLALQKPAASAKKALSQIRKARDAAWKAHDRGDMESTEYRGRMKTLKEREEEIVTNFNKLWMKRVENPDPSDEP